MAGVALVVGAGDALGGAIAERFAQGGFHAVPCRRKTAPLEALAERIRAGGGTATPVACDARDEDAVIAMFDRIEAEIGPVEVAVFNAGAWHNAPIAEMTARIYRQVWDTAAFAGFLVGREAAKRMAGRRSGTIVFTGATASLRGGAGFAAFAGAKFALRALAQAMSRELGPKGIHVAHIVVDGRIDSEAVRERFGDEVAALGDDAMLQPAAIAETFWSVHAQPRDAWTFETEVRPWTERW
ncbi:MAG: SDR family NAD(P)-dependent oxidoreductase [Defluviicoccus sp.]|nr:SDR family NAD(P)-dependent oxidoreductase [Defluviicoccus sp.]MDE0275023.1 SDR family NAD(P)-dependent oxidoreductase [Defluviicoccus sp.]